MSPRAYRIGKRQLATAETRARIVQAARELLTSPGIPSFSIDAVAERADVARMTVYYQFKSKAGLLEALFDDTAGRAEMKRLRTAFQKDDADEGLDSLVETFCRLWASERLMIRRLNALAALDTEVGEALAERQSWRREALEEFARRLQIGDRANEAVDLLHMLTTFETYDSLATPRRSARQVVAMIQRAVRAVVAQYR